MVGGASTTTTTTGDGSTTTTTVAGSTTTTTAGDDPDGIRVVLLEVRDENGSLVAVVEVDGETYTVGVGDTFAVSFKVVSLTESGGVFTFGGTGAMLYGVKIGLEKVFLQKSFSRSETESISSISCLVM